MGKGEKRQQKEAKEFLLLLRLYSYVVRLSTCVLFCFCRLDPAKRENISKTGPGWDEK
jgi:hypothetical protein